ncbi:MAG: PaaI family thioesterase [Actinomycetota bacterium]|nr:PaaI family thioesterase [Actinomycetota bacterium]
MNTDKASSDNSTALADLGSALRELQNVATASGAPADIATAAAESMKLITGLLQPYAAELGSEHDFEHYVATSGSHTLNPPMEILNRGEGSIEMSVNFGPFFRNAFGYVNGGAIASMFDTAIAHVAYAVAGRSFTANLSVDYRNPAPINTELLVKIGLESSEGRKFIVLAQLFNGDVLVSEAHSLLIQPKA